MSEKRIFEVATYCDYGETRVSKVSCYTRFWASWWDGFQLFEVAAVSGKEAKKVAARLRIEAESVRAGAQ